MFITDLFIKRPVLSTVVSLLILLLGFVSIDRLSVRLYPKLELPVISITTAYPGAAPEVMQGFVTSTLKRSLQGIKGINYVTASSTQGLSQIKVHMRLGFDTDLALVNVLQSVASVQNKLPEEARDPVIKKDTSGTGDSILYIAFTSQSMSSAQIGDYVRRVVQTKLQTLPGVAEAKVYGRRYAMRIWLDPIKMAAHGVTPDRVIRALQSQNVQAVAGTVEGHSTSFLVDVTSSLHTVEDFNSVVVRLDDSGFIHIKDIGHAELGSWTYKINAYVGGKTAVMVAIQPLPGANPVTVARAVKQALPDIKATLPPALSAQVVFDVTQFIDASINEVVKTLLEAVAIVVAVIFLFLGSVRAVAVPLVTIPLSLVGVCFLLLLLGYSLNTLTLLAMVLAIGLVVDDAIVVVENIFRHIERGLSPFDAALKGAREIVFPVIGMTITLAAVYFPIGFMQGLTGALFTEFAFTLAAAVIISGIVALTLSPMMCSRLLSSEPSSSRLGQWIERWFERFRLYYELKLKASLRFRPVALLIWIFVSASSIILYKTSWQELAPAEDKGYLQGIAIAPNSSSPKYLARHTETLSKMLDETPEAQQHLYVNGIPDEHKAIYFVILKPWNERKLSGKEIEALMQKKLSTIVGIRAYLRTPAALPGSGDLPVEFVLTSTGSMKRLVEAMTKIEHAADNSGLFLFTRKDVTLDQPKLVVKLNRPVIARLGLTVQEVTKALSTLFADGHVQQFSLQGRSYDVIVQANNQDRLNPESLYNTHMRTKTGELVPLSTFVDFDWQTIPSSLKQMQQLNAVTLSALLFPGTSLGTALDFLRAEAKKVMSPGMSFDYKGQSRQFVQESDKILFIFVISFIFIFLILAAQFESYRAPLVILLGSVPLSLAGALYFVNLAASINIYTQIGLLTLVGLISKHGILMVDFANRIREKDKLSSSEAIVRAAGLRLRPILMTTFATVAGVLPLLFASGAGAVSRSHMGIVITAGMVVGTIFTLFIVPALYTKIMPAQSKNSDCE